MISPAQAVSRLLFRPAAKRLRTASGFASHYLFLVEPRRRRSPFFQQYPYRGNHSLRSVDRHTIVNVEHGFLFHHIPKAANSVVAASLKLQIGGEAVDTRNHDAMKLGPARPNAPSSLSKGQVKDIDQFYKFVVVRNPFDRVLSAYLSKVQKRQTWPMRRSGPRVDSARAPGWKRSPNFAEFCHYLADGGLYYNGHWAPQADFLLFPLHRYDYIGHVESLDRDFSEICHCLFGPGDYRLLAEDPRHATKATRKRDAFYTPELYRLIRKLYAADFEAFGYQGMNC